MQVQRPRTTNNQRRVVERLLRPPKKMNLKELRHLIHYSLKELANDFLGLIKELKKPITWSFIFYAVFGYAVWTNNMNLMAWVVPVLLVIYVYRQKIEGAYKRDAFEKYLKDNVDNDIVYEYYEKYQRDCKYKKVEPLEYPEWKKQEIKRICKTDT